MIRRKTILLVGGGNMGQALLRGWLTRGWDPGAIHVVDPDETARSVAESLGIGATASRPDPLRAAAVVLAVKPHQLAGVLPEYRDAAESRSVFLSIAAGKPLAFFESVLGAGAAVVRGMPNTPAAIAKGITVLTANPAVDGDQRELCESLMSAVGQVAWIEDEGLMDAVTAVSGSGPAYVFLLIECLSAAAVEVGLDKPLADRLALATVAGAGAYASVAQADAAELRRRVTSPGGTTEAALEVLAGTGSGALEQLMAAAVRAATRRGRELA